MTKESKIAGDVLDYLREHPGAADTLEGIATWWVQTKLVSESVDTVYSVLQSLKSEGLVSEKKTPDGRTLYFRNTPQ
jgi:Fe2+ or Zn2+ uptake regulation protein